jgi:hypothetical protein
MKRRFKASFPSLEKKKTQCRNTRETREGWPLLTVETEVNGDSKSTNVSVPSLVGLLGLSCRYKRFFLCLGCSIRPSTKHFFLTLHYRVSNPLSPSPSFFQAGRQFTAHENKRLVHEIIKNRDLEDRGFYRHNTEHKMRYM